LFILIVSEEEYKLWSSSLCSFLQPPVTSSVFGPNIHVSSLFSNILSVCSSLDIRDQVSHPYRTAGKIIVLCIQIFKFLDSRREDKSF
jgi:small basic protein